jgi:hypothetical protein
VILTKRAKLATSALTACVLAMMAATVQAQTGLTFTVDSTQSYLTMTVPNFSYSGSAINLTGENRTNGAPIGTAWSASTTTGNTAFMSGSIATTVGGSLSGKTLTAIQFVSGANNLSALTSGNYRPNPAAYNAATSLYNNNSTVPGNYGWTTHVLLGNGGLVSLTNVQYDIGTNSALAASGTLNSGTFNVNGTGINAGNPVNLGILNSTFSLQGLYITLDEPVFPSLVTSFAIGSGITSAGAGTYTFTNPTNLQIKIPFSVPFTTDFVPGSDIIANGTMSGQIVANAQVPEPSTIGLERVSLNGSGIRSA